MKSVKETRRSVWTKQSFETEKQKVREEVDLVSSKGGIALRHCLNQISDEDETPNARSQLRRFIFIIKALSYHAVEPQLSQTNVKYLAELAEAILRREGVSPVSSNLAFLYGDLHLVLSEIYRKSGQKWAAAWEQHLAAHLSQQSLSAGKGVHLVALAVRTFRLGHTDLAFETLQNAREAGVDSKMEGRCILEQLRCLRLMGNATGFSSFVRAIDVPKLSPETRHELEWEQRCEAAQRTGDLKPLLALVTQKKSSYRGSYVLEAFLWTRAVRSRQWLKDYPTIRSLNAGQKLSSKEQGLFYQFCKSFENCYDFKTPYVFRFQKHGRLLSRVGHLETLDKELLVWGATVRWLSRGRAPEVTALCLKQYQGLSLQVTQGRTFDSLGLLADILEAGQKQLQSA